MEIEKLKDMLRNAAGGPVGIQMCQEAADALEQLQAENGRLQAELEKEEAARKKQADILYELRGQKYEQTTAIDQLRAENDRLKRERDAAVECCSGYCTSCCFENDCAKHDMNDAAPTRWYYGDCEDWEWQGVKEE